MPTAFCPGHITCFFSPGRKDGELLTRGSRGVGIRTSAGSEVTVEETSGNRIRVIIDGVESEAPVTSEVMRRMMEGRGAEVIVKNGLPVGQGFGMSAAGAIAAALCAASITGKIEEEAWEAAHCAEIIGGGGLGDVSALRCLSDVPIRVSEGLPPHGEVIGSGFRFPVLTVAVLGPKMHTGNTLSSPEGRDLISSKGAEAMSAYCKTKTSLFELSNSFSKSANLESPEVSTAISKLQNGGRRAGMCMLGNSIFSDSPYLMVKDALPDAEVIAVMSTSEGARLIRS